MKVSNVFLILCDFVTSSLTCASPIAFFTPLYFPQPYCLILSPNSSALSSCHNRVYQSLANLIRWADQVMLDGIDLEDKENVASVTSVIKAVLDGVKVGPLVIEEMWIVFSTFFSGATEADCGIFLWTGIGKADHRETGAAITHHP